MRSDVVVPYGEGQMSAALVMNALGAVRYFSQYASSAGRIRSRSTGNGGSQSPIRGASVSPGYSGVRVRSPPAPSIGTLPT